MSTFELREQLELSGPPERVWDVLTDPAKTVVCLPGAALTGQKDDRTYEGSLAVAVGPVRVTYRGTVAFEEIDEERGRIRIVGKGREKTGSGSAEMTMESVVRSDDGRTTQVSIEAQVRVTGRLVSLGRGMIEAVSAEMLTEFRTRLGRELEDQATEGDGVGVADGMGEPRGTEGPETAGEPEATGEPGATDRPEATDREANRPIPLLPLLFRAFRSWLRRLIGRP